MNFTGPLFLKLSDTTLNLPGSVPNVQKMQIPILDRLPDRNDSSLWKAQWSCHDDVSCGKDGSDRASFTNIIILSNLVKVSYHLRYVICKQSDLTWISLSRTLIQTFLLKQTFHPRLKCNLWDMYVS